VKADGAAALAQPAEVRRGIETGRHDVSGWGRRVRARRTLPVAMAVSAADGEEGEPHHPGAAAVEAGERLGFLPGSLQEKVDPYLRPLYDALYDLLDQEKVDKLLERNVIEVAPLAFMRGRTLSDAFHHHGRGAEHDQRADEMFVHAHGQRLEGGDHRRSDADRSAESEAVRVCLRRCRCWMAWREFASATSRMSTSFVTTWCSALCGRTTATVARNIDAAGTGRCGDSVGRGLGGAEADFQSRNKPRTSAEGGRRIGSSSIRERMITLEPPRGKADKAKSWLELAFRRPG